MIIIINIYNIYIFISAGRVSKDVLLNLSCQGVKR